jgi:hypothetical protein
MVRCVYMFYTGGRLMCCYLRVCFLKYLIYCFENGVVVIDIKFIHVYFLFAG